ncbi:winged helix-turn-helix transcriptional regulator [Rhodococcus sp. NPDC003318]|uniref:winged helix-turn-helix transcriptional regulator n=1 Tax=Rhodococcus sp. NPDC003318 TaxID=3364503 RepID=UPI0036BD2708
MVRRSYDQFCGLSRALDVVGERWTLLVVRELMSGPKRYSDLADALRGIGTSLLAARLKQLESDGIVARRYLRPPAASTVYELTEVGQELATALVPLALWGARHQTCDGRAPSERFQAEWALQFLVRMLDPERLVDLDASYEFRIDGSVARLSIADGAAQVQGGQTGEVADATITTDASTMAAIAGSRIGVLAALEDGLVEVDGDADSLARLLKVLEAYLDRDHGPVAASST